MRAIRPELAALAWLLACTPPDVPSGSDAAELPDAKLPVCPQSAALFMADLSGNQSDLPATGGKLPVILGFQGFVFVRVGLKSPLQLPSPVKARVQAQVPPDLDVTTLFSPVKTHAESGAWLTKEMVYFFNDVPFAELPGKPVTVTIAIDTPQCRLVGTATATLENGGVMGAGAALWGTIDAGSTDAAPLVD